MTRERKPYWLVCSDERPMKQIEESRTCHPDAEEYAPPTFDGMGRVVLRLRCPHCRFEFTEIDPSLQMEL